MGNTFRGRNNDKTCCVTAGWCDHKQCPPADQSGIAAAAAAACDGHQSCPLSFKYFGANPCEGIYNYVSVEWSCVLPNGSVLPAPPPPPPSPQQPPASTLCGTPQPPPCPFFVDGQSTCTPVPGGASTPGGNGFKLTCKNNK